MKNKETVTHLTLTSPIESIKKSVALKKGDNQKTNSENADIKELIAFAKSIGAKKF